MVILLPLRNYGDYNTKRGGIFCINNEYIILTLISGGCYDFFGRV